MAVIEVKLPILHASQASIYRERSRFNLVRCGRRWGKDVLQNTIAANTAAKGGRVGLFAPEHKQLVEPFNALREILYPIRKKASGNDGRIETSTSGVIDFWHVDDNELAGRGREYDVVCINEAAFTKTPSMRKEIWPKSIRPTLLVRKGSAWVFSTPNGIDEENFFYACEHDTSLGFKAFHAPTIGNPLISEEDIEFERKNNDPRVFNQEFLAQYVDWSGAAFFSADSLLFNGQPVDYPAHCDMVFAAMDTAVKEGKEHDGTAVVYGAVTRHGYAWQLVILDWDIFQIEGAMLETKMPEIFKRLEEFAKTCRARQGSVGVFIEDAQSGSILLQQGRRHNWPVHAIESKLTSAGKDGRAISISGYVYRGLVKFSRHAYEKTTHFKDSTRNHLWSQITSFRIGDKDAAKRSDDLLDCFLYSSAITLGNTDGY